eukprot:IDg12981t1
MNSSFMRLSRRLSSFITPLQVPFGTRSPHPLHSRAQCARSAILMGHQKYYAIRAGRGGFKGIVNTWSECERHVKGVSGAMYKKFSTLEQAHAYTTSSKLTTVNKAVRGPPRGRTIEKKRSTRTASSIPAEMLERSLCVYTDGACAGNGQRGARAGYGKWKTAGGVTDVKNRDIWEKLDAFKSTYEDMGIPFDLVWVKGHAANPGNEAADRLAVAGAGKNSADSGPKSRITMIDWSMRRMLTLRSAFCLRSA